jgi:inner membrane protein involved in colicin E2 resistance
VSYTIICIPTKSSSNEIDGLIVIFIPLQLTLGHVVECIRDRIRLLDDIPNGVTLTQKIVAGSVLPITEILTIENDKLHSTFLHVAFRS